MSDVSEQSHAVRYQGFLLKSRKHLGFKTYWVVITNGHIIYYRNEKEAQLGRPGKRIYSLTNAIVRDYPNAGPRNYLAYSFTIYFSDCKRHTLCALAVPKKGLKKSILNLTEILKRDNSKINGKLLYKTTERKEKWLNALRENIQSCDFNTEPNDTPYLYHRSIFESGKSDYDNNDPTDSISNSSESESETDEYFDALEDLNSLDHLKFESSIARNGLAKEMSKNVPINAVNNDDSEFDELGWRRKLPAKQFDRSQISIWSLLKHFIGRELTRITMPVFLCEPLTFLERLSENAQYSYLLHKALDFPDNPSKRIECIAAFAASPCSSIERLSKPFNPVLGETYELIRDDLAFKLVAEQVSHHPPVSAFHSQSTDKSKLWNYYGSVQPKIKFWGKSVQVDTQGLLTVEFPSFSKSLNETYTWRPIPCMVHNIVIGTMWFEFSGLLEVVCHETGMRALLNFHSYSSTNKELNKVDGFVYDKEAIYGYWTHCFYSCEAQSYESYIKIYNKRPPVGQFDQNYYKIDCRTQKDDWPRNIEYVDSMTLLKDFKEIWTIWPKPSNCKMFYNFSLFTMSLNQMRPEFEKLIAPTDSRFRNDLKQLEMGNLDAANDEKSRIEDKQRDAHKKNSGDWKPSWFSFGKHKFIEEKTWTFNNKYWLRDYRNCPDLF